MPILPYQDPALAPEQRAADLLGRMSLEEKVGQLRSYLIYEPLAPPDGWAGWLKYNALSTSERIAYAGGLDVSDPVRRGVGHLPVAADLPPELAARSANRVQRAAVEGTRLGIPVMLHHEGLHGLLANGATIFPQAIGLACAWNPGLVEQVGAAAAREARARGIRQLLSPTVNIARDARAGRTQETYGEDPYLTSRLAVAYVRGSQAEGVVATPKHFAANFAGDGGRDSHPIYFSEGLLREVFFPAFEACVREGGALSIMAAYNSIDGLPCSCDPWLLTTVLREEWGFQGYVVSDYWSVEHIYSKHAVAAGLGEAGRLALEAGLDVELPEAHGFGQDLLDNLGSGRISQAALDAAVRRVLEVKIKIGLLEEPYVDEAAAAPAQRTPQHRELALRAARESLVLLKNETGVLPIRPDCARLAVIGPLADAPALGGYTWDRVPREQVITALEGIRSQAGMMEICCSQGCELERAIPGGVQAAVEAARSCDLAVLCVGSSAEMEGEGRDRANLALPDAQVELIRAVVSSGVPTVVVLQNGSPVTMGEWLDSVGAVLEAWYPGEQGGQAIGEVLFGRTNPSGKLAVTFPRSVGQLPLYYNPRPSGRDEGYVDESGAARFPFGHGLSYTSFAYRGLQICRPSPYLLRVSFELENTGSRAGVEVAQLYVRDVTASLVRPVKELKAFRRVDLQPGETGEVALDVPVNQLGFFNRAGEYVIEPGEFELMVGASSQDIRLRGVVRLGE